MIKGKIFLNDGIGALLSVICLWFIGVYLSLLGIQYSTLQVLLLWPILFALYSIIIHFIKPIYLAKY
jgi:hypothetical protein